MTVAELSPLQLYGLIVLAFGVFWVFLQSIRLYPDLDWRAKIMFWAGCAFLFGVPAYSGLSALAP